MPANAPLLIRQRSVVLVTPDADLRDRISGHLLSMRWTVLSASGGAEAMAYLGPDAPEAMIIDHWLPDLDAAEFTEHVGAICPATDLLHMDGSASQSQSRSARRNELLYALRAAQEGSAPVAGVLGVQASAIGNATYTPANNLVQAPSVPLNARDQNGDLSEPVAVSDARVQRSEQLSPRVPLLDPMPIRMHLPDMVGDSPAMRELSRMVRLVAPHAATVLVQGETGTGKELVAKAVHRLSARSTKAFVVLNCAAIPEHLLEAELFGHTRGAFTGAVTSRVGRIEAAHGGTLFLDEIGEMPLALQAKMLRFLESGEIQRVGDNDISRVDVRIVAATHQSLQANADEKLFRLDLYHRLAVFPVEVPSLRDRRQDIPMLVENFLQKAAEHAPRKSIEHDALLTLLDYPWGGNVRELCHVLLRAVIMAGDAPVIAREHLRMREAPRNL